MSNWNGPKKKTKGTDDMDQMNSREFCYFLKGFLEISGADKFSKEQVVVIKDRLDSVFKEVEYTVSISDVEEAQQRMDVG